MEQLTRENIAIGSNSQQGVSGQTTGRYNVSLGVNSLFGLQQVIITLLWVLTQVIL